MSGLDSFGYGMTVPGDDAGPHGHAPAPLSTGAIVGIAIAAAVRGRAAAGRGACLVLLLQEEDAARGGDDTSRRHPWGGLELAGAGGGATGRSTSAAAAAVATGRDAPGAGSGRDAPRCSSAAAAAGHAAPAGPSSGAGGRSSSAAAAVTAGHDAPAGPSSGAVGGAGCRLCRAGYGVEVAVALDCGHSFHRRCIRRWMHHNMSCPTCNATHIGFLGDSSEFRLQRSGEHAPRRSVDAASTQDDLLEISRSTSSRF
ncbi:unnamed protein product [Urochloa decumbens]|uniref:RING-type domain-containing protein n=1 Tax=Urochloa decumbens TaxID=240449 RepID=A0ABC9BRC4_9POAL